eukprot:3704934-Alexandrium_andersonii.AAC.1
MLRAGTRVRGADASCHGNALASGADCLGNALTTSFETPGMCRSNASGYDSSASSSTNPWAIVLSSTDGVECC